jgi:hypothetical protein
MGSNVIDYGKPTDSFFKISQVSDKLPVLFSLYQVDTLALIKQFSGY